MTRHGPNFLPYDSQIPGTSWGGMKRILQNFSLLRKGWFPLELYQLSFPMIPKSREPRGEV